MDILLALKERHTFTPNGDIPRQMWGDELQAVWMAKELRRREHRVDIVAEHDFSGVSAPQSLLPEYDVVVYFEPTVPRFPRARFSIFWHQCASHDAIGQYDFILTGSYTTYQAHRDEPVAYFVSAIDPEDRHFVTPLQDSCDVLFIGNYLVRTPDRYVQYLDPLLGRCKMHVYGNAWPDSQYSAVSKGKLNLYSTNAVISGAKLYLNIL